MYKLLIVDDEKHVRTAIQIALDKEKLQLSSVHEAIDGQCGLRALREFRPDLVCVDIKMPLMNGIEFLQIATAEFPDTKFVIISGFDDFIYAKQAIQFGVFDYLLKPINRNELNLCMEKAIAAIESERETQNYQINQGIINNLSAPLLKEKLVTTILEGGGVHPPILQDYKKIVNVTDQEVIFGIAVFNIVNFNEVCNVKFKGDSYSCYFAMTNIIEELCSSWSHGFSIRNYKSAHEMITVLEINNDMHHGTPREYSAGKLNLAVETLENMLGVYSVVGVGSFYSDFDDVYRSYYEAEDIIASVNILRNNDTVYVQQDGSRKNNMISIASKRDLLIRGFESGSIEFTRNILHEYFNDIKKAGYFSMSDLHKATTEFILMLEDISVQLGVVKEDGGSHFINLERQLIRFTSLEEFCEFVFQMTAQIFDRIHTKIKASESFHIDKIKDYIDHNYYKDINLSMFSEQYYLTKEYLSKLFKENYGSGIYEYVLKVRMEKAKALLDDPSVKIQQISDSIGYHDNNYFSKAFKKYYGCSPTEYRNRIMHFDN